MGLIEKVIDDDVNYPKDNFTKSEEIETSGNKLMMLFKTQDYSDLDCWSVDEYCREPREVDVMVDSFQ